MKGTDFLNQYSQAIELAERRITEFKEFSERYNLNESNYFVDKLIDEGYAGNELSTILFNKDLMLSLYMNNFELLEISSNDTIIDIDVEIEEARKQYIEAVDNANQSFEAANEARDMMMSLKELIEREFGFDSNNWDNKSIRDMNDAITVYNRLVEQANKDSEICSLARQELARVRNEHSNGSITDVIQKNVRSIANEKNLVLETS